MLESRVSLTAHVGGTGRSLQAGGDVSASRVCSGSLLVTARSAVIGEAPKAIQTC